MTSAQQATFKAWLDANAAGLSDDQAAALANGLASPTYWVWRTSLSQLEAVTATTAEATAWSWTTYIGRSQGERDGWREMFADGGTVNPSLVNVRAGIADIFSGAGGAAQRTHMLTIGRRGATNFEKLFTVAATGGGNDGIAGNRGKTTNPDALVIEGQVTAQQVAETRG